MVTPEVEHDVGTSKDDLASLFLLESVRGFGPQKFKDLHEAGLRPIDVLLEPDRLPMGGKRGDTFRQAIRTLDEHDRELAQARAVRQLVRAHEHQARIVTYADPLYPPAVYESNNPVPVLYVRGTAGLLTHARSVACVGSRKIEGPYSGLHFEFATVAARAGFAITSGFALGADTIGHEAALHAGGPTVLVMPSGLDRPFPPENKQLWDELLQYRGATMVSEFPFGTAAASLTLRKRNKLIVAFARGVLLSQTSQKGGAMNAYRFAVEQHKPVATFEPDDSDRTSGNRFIGSQGVANGRQGAFDTEHPEVQVTVFPARAEPAAWEAWLRQLSSST